MRRDVYEDPTEPATIESQSPYDINVRSIDSPTEQEMGVEQPDESYTVSLEEGDSGFVANIYHNSELSRADASMGSDYWQKVGVSRNDIPEIINQSVEHLLEPEN